MQRGANRFFSSTRPAFFSLLVSCGARTGLQGTYERGPADGGQPAETGAMDVANLGADVRSRDAGIDGGAKDSGLPRDDGGRDTGVRGVDGGAGDAEAGPPMDASSGNDSGPPVCSNDPCLSAPALTAGGTASGTTCGAVNPSGCTCSDGPPTVFYSFVVPPMTELSLTMSADLVWGVLCGCPESVCCAGPGGTTGPDGTGTAIANRGASPMSVTLALSRLNVDCGGYTVSLGP